MKISLCICAIFALFASGYSQVGIGNTNPNASLDITASNVASPAATDGILVPRVDEMPGTNPTAAQDGMLVFATGNGSIAKGFYYWNNATTSWQNLGGANAINQLNDGKSDADGTDDGSSIFLGIGSGFNDDSTNNRNIGLGIYSLYSNTDGSNNIAIGASTLQNNTSGVNNVSVGESTLAFNTTGAANVALGGNALFLNQTGNNNVALGSVSLRNNTTGSSNSSVGVGTLYNNTTGQFNSAFGNQALENNVSGSYATAIGASAMRYANNTTTAFINNNVALGYEALRGSTTPANNTGNFNVALGNQTLRNNTTGTSNIAVGQSSLLNNTTGTNNIALGNSTLQAVSTGFSNVGIGHEALYTNTGNGNTGIGFHTLYNNTTGSDNIAIGFDTMYHHISGGGNIAIGSQGLRANTTGESNNTFGRYALSQNTDGNNNTAIGFATMYNNLNGSGNVALGHYAGFNETGSNKLYIDNSGTSTPLLYGEFDNDLLRINGIAQVGNPASGGYQLPTADGTANQVLQTDGSGTVSWQNSDSFERVAFKVRQGSNITAYNLYTYIPVIMTSLQYNYGGGSYDTSTGGYTVPHDGVYQVQVSFSVSFGSTFVDNMLIFLRMYSDASIAGQRTVQQEPSTSRSWGLNYSFNFQTYFDAGDVISFQYLIGINGTDTPRPIITSNGSAQSEISIARIY